MNRVGDRGGIERDAGVAQLGVMVVGRLAGSIMCRGEGAMVDAVCEAGELREQQRRRQQDRGSGAEFQEHSRNRHYAYLADTGVASVRR